jgi:hypothetical protein
MLGSLSDPQGHRHISYELKFLERQCIVHVLLASSLDNRNIRFENVTHLERNNGKYCVYVNGYQTKSKFLPVLRI